MGGPAMLAAGVAGMDVTFVAVALNTTPIVIMGTVSRMEELKGKGIGHLNLSGDQSLAHGRSAADVGDLGAQRVFFKKPRLASYPENRMGAGNCRITGHHAAGFPARAPCHGT